MNKGRVLLSEELVLEWLKFQKGRILGISYDYDRQVLILLIEHPDMPDVEENKPFRIVQPTYTIKPETYERTGMLK